MIVLSCNVRGLGKGEKKCVVRSLVEFYKPTIVFLQETKLSNYDDRVIKAIGGSALNRGIGVDAEGALGGLLSLWNEDQFKVSDCISNSRCLILIGELLSMKAVAAFCNVYVASVEGEGRKLWDFLINSMNSFSISWCIGGQPK
ncbi:hypothetical protein Ddye_022182 [Dipteronia dyeriana]|uniref:Endonuclease/exonuclease/phosphatase domain-containing protein n=1 Tax=Dipteronia dyeriana TaxID=168575 RepID=A0AAD9U366_9ROSI|nr:hypothetical protein Ddye_022182 [Dipteronia dyeriana]